MPRACRAVTCRSPSGKRSPCAAPGRPACASREWEDYYNYHRPHGALGGQTPYERLKQKTTQV
ncbi:integrase core domain-containing protein [Microbispora corallina]|uniref:integrase core domain-containing protein n=1 Tax=Microbispora corallina TaxID=83302 RepID=UPI0035590C37